MEHESLFARPDFVITRVIHHWPGPTEPIANAEKRALLIAAPLRSFGIEDPDLLRAAEVVLAKQGFHIVEMERASAVCICGEVPTENVRSLLSECRRRGLRLINWAGPRTALDRYARALWSHTPGE